jgi:hypothetical protein
MIAPKNFGDRQLVGTSGQVSGVWQAKKFVIDSPELASRVVISIQVDQAGGFADSEFEVFRRKPQKKVLFIPEQVCYQIQGRFELPCEA